MNGGYPAFKKLRDTSAADCVFFRPWKLIFASSAKQCFGRAYIPPWLFLFLQDYAAVVAGGEEHVLLDVRARVQFAVCALDGAVNIPLPELEVYRFLRASHPRFTVF